MVQYLIVAIIVAAAACWAAAKYLPMTWRQRLVHRLSRGTGKGRLAEWVGGAGSGCGSGCDTCGTCETEPPAQTEQGRKVIKLHVQR